MRVFFLLILSPYLGALSDKKDNKKSFLVFFALIGIFFSASLAFVPIGAWQWAILIYILGVIGFQGANIFYDSLLPKIAKKNQVDYASSLGFSLGYIGGGIFFLGAVFLYLKPEWFGLENGVQGIKLSFIGVAIWWAIFSLPLILVVKEEKSNNFGFFYAMNAAFQQLKETLKNIQKYDTAFKFLIAYWFYIDGATTLIKMAVDFGISLGFPASSLIVALLLVQFIAFPASLIYYKFSSKVGIKKGILIAIFAYCIITFLGYFMQTTTHFYILALGIGLFQGGLFALSRSYFSKLVPDKQEGEFFGFYTLWTRFASLLGPLMVGVIARYSGNPRLGVLSIVLLFLIGGILLFRIKEK